MEENSTVHSLLTNVKFRSSGGVCAACIFFFVRFRSLAKHDKGDAVSTSSKGNTVCMCLSNESAILSLHQTPNAQTYKTVY